jgi:splicing factor U2AF subunit
MMAGGMPGMGMAGMAMGMPGMPGMGMAGSPTAVNPQQLQQQMQMQQQLMMMRQQQVMNMLPAQQAGSKKQRELYVGNLTTGMVGEQMLREIFTGLLEAIPGIDKSKGPLLANVQLASEGKFGFIEFRDEEIAATALKFAGIEIAGRSVKIGRPSGYVQPANGPPQVSKERE